MNQATPDTQLFTIAVFTENHVGMISQISAIFTRRCINVDTLIGSPSSMPGIHKFTITCHCDRRSMEKVVAQIEKGVDVLCAFLLTDDDIIYQEVALYKVPSQRLLEENRLEGILRQHKARIISINPDNTILEMTGHEHETEALFEVLKGYGIRQFVRSGRIAVTRSPIEHVHDVLAEEFKRRVKTSQESE